MIKFAAHYVLYRPVLLSLMIGCGLMAALFEGGTLAILASAVSVLVDEGGTDLGLIEMIPGDSPRAWIETLPNPELFLGLVGVACIAQITKSAMTYLSEVAQIRIIYGLALSVQQKVVKEIMTRNYGEISKFPAGELSALVEQSFRTCDFVSLSGKAVRAFFMLGVYLALMMALSVKLTVIAAAILIVLWWSITTLVNRIRVYAETAANEQIKTWKHAVEFFNAPRLLRIFNSGARAEKVIETARRGWLEAEQKSTTLMAAVIPSFEAIAVIGAGMFLIIAFLFAGEDSVKLVSKTFVFVIVFFRLKPQVQQINTIRLQFFKLLPLIDKPGRFLNTKKESYDRVGGTLVQPLAEAIDLENVSFRYPGEDQCSLKNVSFSIPKGSMVALVGGSGAGKTTLISLLIGLYSPESGAIYVDGRDLAALDLQSWRTQLGIVDQDVFLLNDSVASNIAFGRDERDRQKIVEAADHALATKFIEELPHGFDTIIGDRGHRLSGGQRQRLALARALYHGPSFLILDEATSALDSISERLVQQAIEQMHHEKTMLVIAHRLSTIERADRIVVLENGQVVEMGSPRELLSKKDGRYREYLSA